jgi:hypothetical protein
MFCPSCRDEFRAGFTRCESCGMDLVADLSVIPAVSPVQAPGAPGADRIGGRFSSRVVEHLPPTTPVHMVDYCGFRSLEDARQARDQLRPVRVRAEIAIREAPGSALDQPVHEEYWLRVDAARYQQAWDLLGFDAVAGADGGNAEPATIACSACGETVAEEESFCPKCGARFEED